MNDLQAPRLTADEDAVLRRLAFFEGIGGSLAPSLRVLRSELRARDRRHEIREPVASVVRLYDEDE